MNIDLTVQRLGNDTLFRIVYSNARLITGSFDTQYPHFGSF
jgi:hypothetical protein